VSCCGLIVSSFTLSQCFRQNLTPFNCSPVGGQRGPDRWPGGARWGGRSAGPGRRRGWFVRRRIGRRMTPCLLRPFPLSSRSRPHNALLPENGPSRRLISRRPVMSLHKHGTRMGATVTCRVVFGAPPTAPSRKKCSRFMWREHAPATQEQQGEGRKKKNSRRRRRTSLFRLLEVIVKLNSHA